MIVPLAAKAHHRAHIEPVARLLGLDLEMARTRAQDPDDVALVASYGDMPAARRGGFRRIILMQHGAGQSYGGDRRTARHPCYAGGDDNDDVGLFLTPNEHAANRWRARYPAASVEVVGCPRLDALPARAVGVHGAATTGPVVAVSFHWSGYKVPEWESAIDHYRHAVADLSRAGMTIIGHGHPHDAARISAMFGAAAIEFVADFDDVLRRADIYVCDNSSTLFEFASTGRPVVVLNAPWYRPEADHGLRFWDAQHVGVNAWEPAELGATIERAADPRFVAAREKALDIVYAQRTGAAQRAADAVAAWAGVAVAA